MLPLRKYSFLWGKDEESGTLVLEVECEAHTDDREESGAVERKRQM